MQLNYMHTHEAELTTSNTVQQAAVDVALSPATKCLGGGAYAFEVSVVLIRAVCQAADNAFLRVGAVCAHHLFSKHTHSRDISKNTVVMLC
jgi:hypothetical protein